jgi:hypothetical protein
VRRFIRCFFVFLLVTVGLVVPSHAQNAPSGANTDSVPAPSTDRIHYAKPEEYIVVSPSFGDAKRIRQVASSLKKATPEQTLVAIGTWINSNLRYDDKAAYAWRNFDDALNTKVYGGCADHALVFAALVRACGIPAVFVKTMDADWIREFRTTGTSQSWRGHVFLEVYLNGKWNLLDAAAMQLYDQYDPAMRLLPGNRYAYDKGADPYALLLSLDWERWKKQTAAYFGGFDLARLPVGEGRALRDPANEVWIAANSPIYQAVTERGQQLGKTVRTSFNDEFDQYLPKAKSGYLVVTCVGNKVVLPEAYHAQYLPVSLEELRRRVQKDEQGTLRKQLPDGTRVVLVYGKDNAAIINEISRLELDAKP